MARLLPVIAPARLVRFFRQSLIIALISLACLILALRFSLPWLGHYQNDLEAWLSDRLHAEVQFRDMKLFWRHDGPALSVSQLRISRDDQVLLALGEVTAEASLGNFFLSGGRGLVDRFFVRDLELELIRDANGFRLNGVPLPESQSDQPPKLPQWLSQSLTLLEVEGATLRYQDALRGEVSTLQQASIKAHNNGDNIRFGVTALLPADLGGGDFRTVIEVDPERSLLDQPLSGFVSVDRLSLAGVKSRLPLSFLPERLAGSVATQAWFNGSPTGNFTVKMSLEAESLAVEADKASPLWQASSLRFALNAYRRDGNWGAVIDPLDVVQAGNIWQARQLSLSYTQQQATPRLGVMAQLLPLTELNQLAQAVAPLLPPSPVREQLKQWQFSGAVVNAAAVLALPKAQAPTLETLDAKVANLGLVNAERAFAIQGINGRTAWKAEQNQVRFALRSKDLRLQLGRVFRQPLNFTQVEAPLVLGFDPTSKRAFLSTEGAALSLAGGRAVVDARLRLEPEQPPELDMALHASQIDPMRLARFLPAGVMKSHLLTFLDNAVHAGQVDAASVVLRGPLTKPFPYQGTQGQFIADVQASGVELKFSPQWPHITELDAELLFANRQLSARASRANFEGAKVTKGLFSVADILAPELKLELSAESEAERLMDFARTGPLRRLLAKPLAPIELRGPTRLNVDLSIPLVRTRSGQPKPLSLAGSIEARSATLSVPAIGFVLEQVHGELAFTEKALQAEQIRGLHLGQSLSLSLDDNAQRVAIRAKSSSAALSPLLQRWLPVLAPEFQGSTAFEALLYLPKPAAKPAQSGYFRLESQLKGARITLPEPLAKAPPQALALRVETPLGEQAGKQWQVRLGERLWANARVADGRLAALSVALGSEQNPASLENGTVRVRGKSRQPVDVDAWLALVSELPQRLASLSPSPAAASKPASSSPFRLDLALETPQLRLFDQPIPQAAVSLNGDGALYSGRFDNPWASGEYELINDQKTAKLAHVTLALDRLSLDRLIEDLAKDAPPSAKNKATLPDPRQLPPLFVKIKDLHYKKIHLERLQLRTRALRGGLELLSLSNYQRGIETRGRGYWLIEPDGQHRSELSLSAELDNLGHALNSMGFDNAATEGDGVVSASLRWPGALYLPDLPQTEGQIKLHLLRGRLVDIEPGFGRLMGLFALSSLPRRLSFDFNDLLVEGLVYDEILGTVNLNDGKASTEQLLLKGPVGLVSMSGETDYAKELYDQSVVILPNIGASLPILTVLASGAGAGVGVLLADQLLKGLGINIDEIGRLEYTITGPWDQPKILKVEPKQFVPIERDR